MSVDFHFLNVGAGDCSIVLFPERKRDDGKVKNERVMMIDICHNESSDEYEDVLEYYKMNFIKNNGTVKPIFRFIFSHPHQDHICGLNEFVNDNEIIIWNCWDLDHSWEPEDFEHYPTHEDDWNTYKNLVGSNSSATVIRTKREDTPEQFWNDDEDRISVLSPSKYLTEYAHYKEDGTKRDIHKIEIDEISYCLLIKINDRKILLASDGRKSPHWNDIYENCKNEIKDCAILKAGHHGQESSFHEDAIKWINPEYIIFSNSETEDKENGAEKLYSKAVPDAQILKTFEKGTIVLKIPFKNTEEIEKYYPNSN